MKWFHIRYETTDLTTEKEAQRNYRSLVFYWKENPTESKPQHIEKIPINPAIICLNSYHWNYKLGVFRNFTKRAYTHCSSKEKLQNEFKWIVEIGAKHAYRSTRTKLIHKPDLINKN